MNKLISFLLLFFLTVVANAQQDSLLWDQDSTLRWSDFKGSPDPQSHFSALTHAEIRYKVTMVKGLVRFDFVNLFLKKNSWTKNATSQALLKHEQVHFDIAELHKRLMISLLYTRNLRRYNFEREVKQLGDSINAIRNQMDDAFDKEVLPIAGEKGILKWQLKIDQELKRLKAYDRNSFLVKLND